MHIRLPDILKTKGQNFSNNFQHLLTSINKRTNQITCNLIWRRRFPAYPFNNPPVCTVLRH